MVIVGKVLAVWFGILLLAMLNGILREAVLIPGLGLTAAMLTSGLLLAGLIVVVSVACLPWLGVRTAPGLLRIGLAWLLLTLVFEFSFGLMRGLDWQQMLEPYRFKDANLWPLVLLVTVLAPRLAARLRGWF